MALFFIGLLILSPLPIVAMLGGIHLVGRRFQVMPVAKTRTSRRARGFKPHAQTAANRNQRPTIRKAA